MLDLARVVSVVFPRPEVESAVWRKKINWSRSFSRLRKSYNTNVVTAASSLQVCRFSFSLIAVSSAHKASRLSRRSSTESALVSRDVIRWLWLDTGACTRCILASSAEKDALNSVARSASWPSRRLVSEAMLMSLAVVSLGSFLLCFPCLFAISGGDMTLRS